MPDITPAPSDRKPDTTRRSWHRKASRPVSGWLLALLIVAVASPTRISAVGTVKRHVRYQGGW